MKTGRPKLKRGLAKSVQIGVRFEPAEYKEIRAAAKRNMCKVPSWIRYVVRKQIQEFTEPPSTGKPLGTFKLVKLKKKIPNKFVGWQTERIPGDNRCPQCNSVRIKDILRDNGTTTHKCHMCGLMWEWVRAKTD